MQIKYIIIVAIILGALFLGASSETVQKRLGDSIQDQELICKTASSSDFSIAANTSMVAAATNTTSNRLWVKISASSTPQPIWANPFNRTPAVHGEGEPVFSTSTVKIQDYFGPVHVISQAATTFSVTECFY